MNFEILNLNANFTYTCILNFQHEALDAQMLTYTFQHCNQITLIEINRRKQTMFTKICEYTITWIIINIKDSKELTPSTPLQLFNQLKICRRDLSD